MKKLLSILALTTIFGLTACGPTTNPSTTPTNPTVPTEPSTNEPDKYNFYVTVSFENGDPFEGARVQVCTLDQTMCMMPVTTDAEGKCTLELELNSYVVHILNVPEGYFYDEDGYILSEENSSVDVVLFQTSVARQW